MLNVRAIRQSCALLSKFEANTCKVIQYKDNCDEIYAEKKPKKNNQTKGVSTVSYVSGPSATLVR